MTKEAVILAGGLGTRIRDVVPDAPKSMALINNKPFLEYLLNYLNQNGITRVILSIGYKYEKISAYFQQNYKNIELVYSVESEPLGTGGATALAMKSVRSDDVFILNGDTLFNIDMKRLFDFHMIKESDFSLALRRVEDASRYGMVSCNDEDRITEFREKDAAGGAGLINGGVYIVKTKHFNLLKLSGKFSLENDFFAKSCMSSRIYGFVSDDYFLDIGIPDDYYKAQNEFKKFENG